MASIDITAFLEQCGIRKARFGGLEPEDVRLALEAFAAEYEDRLNKAENETRKLAQDNAGLEKHCKTMTAQVRLLTEQNMNLAKSNETFTRQLRDLSNQNSSLKDKNRSLSDQNQVLLLKNRDLERSQQQMRVTTDKASAEYAVKGKQLEEARKELVQQRDSTLAAAQAQAEKTMTEARQQADALLKEANDTALAIQQTALNQARKQARELVENATNEANEVHNVQQLRLTSLKAEVAEMEKRRAALLEYLIRMGSELLNIEAIARAADPDAVPASAASGQETDDQTELELKPIEMPEVQLDLTPETVAKTAAELADAAPAQEKEPAARDLPWTGPDDLEQPRRSAQDKEPRPKAKAHAGPGEVPGAPVGAIFSMPIVHSEEPVPVALPAEPPKKGPRAPLLPDLGDEEDEDGADEPELLPMPDLPDLSDLPDLPEPGGEPQPAPTPARMPQTPPQKDEPEVWHPAEEERQKAARKADTPARARALRAVKALRSIRQK